MLITWIIGQPIHVINKFEQPCGKCTSNQNNPGRLVEAILEENIRITRLAEMVGIGPKTYLISDYLIPSKLTERIRSKRLDHYCIKHLILAVILLVSINTGIIIALSPSALGSVQRDMFGISEIYPSAVNGNEWYSMWEDGHMRITVSGQRDQYDKNFEVTGNGEVTIDGIDGIATITGGAPRMRVPDLDFGNVEITFYAKRISEEEEISYQGFVAGARSKHYTNDLCGANTYYGRFTYDGRVSFEKELFHGHGEPAQYPHADEPSKYIWPEDEGIPDDEWIGLKFVLKTLPNQEGVLLELYRDLTDGSNGGQWEKVLNYNDTGEWYVEADDGICGDYPHNKILLTPGFVFIRNDFIDQAQYKKFSIREIT